MDHPQGERAAARAPNAKPVRWNYPRRPLPFRGALSPAGRDLRQHVRASSRARRSRDAGTGEAQAAGRARRAPQTPSALRSRLGADAPSGMTKERFRSPRYRREAVAFAHPALGCHACEGRHPVSAGTGRFAKASPQPRQETREATSKLRPHDPGLLDPGLRLRRNRDDILWMGRQMRPPSRHSGRPVATRPRSCRGPGGAPEPRAGSGRCGSPPPRRCLPACRPRRWCRRRRRPRGRDRSPSRRS